MLVRRAPKIRAILAAIIIAAALLIAMPSSAYATGAASAAPNDVSQEILLPSDSNTSAINSATDSIPIPTPPVGTVATEPPTVDGVNNTVDSYTAALGTDEPKAVLNSAENKAASTEMYITPVQYTGASTASSTETTDNKLSDNKADEITVPASAASSKVQQVRDYPTGTAASAGNDEIATPVAKAATERTHPTVTNSALTAAEETPQGINAQAENEAIYTVRYDLNNDKRTNPNVLTSVDPMRNPIDPEELTIRNVTLSQDGFDCYEEDELDANPLGYEFAGWNTNRNGEGMHVKNGATFAEISEFIDPHTQQASITLYAQWREMEIYILYLADDNGTVDRDVDWVTAVTGTHIAEYSSPGTPLRVVATPNPGYRFVRWVSVAPMFFSTNATSMENSIRTSGADGSELIIEAPAAGSCFYFAQYVACFEAEDMAVLLYDPNGGSGSVEPMSGPEGTSLTLSYGTELKKLRHTLVGWNTMPDGSGETYSLGQTDYVLEPGTTSLYAMWKAVSYSVIVVDCDTPRGSVKGATSEATRGGYPSLGFMDNVVVTTKPGFIHVGWTYIMNDPETGVEYTGTITDPTFMTILGSTSIHPVFAEDPNYEGPAIPEEPDPGTIKPDDPIGYEPDPEEPSDPNDPGTDPDPLLIEDPEDDPFAQPVLKDPHPAQFVDLSFDKEWTGTYENITASLDILDETGLNNAIIFLTSVDPASAADHAKIDNMVYFVVYDGNTSTAWWGRYLDLARYRVAAIRVVDNAGYATVFADDAYAHLENWSQGSMEEFDMVKLAGLSNFGFDYDPNIFNLKGDATLLDGTGGTFDPNEFYELWFRFAENAEDFRAVEVDGITVPTNCYTVEQGSTVIKFSPDYVKTLGAGNHEVLAYFDRGLMGTAGFRLSADGSNVYGDPSGSNVGGEDPVDDPGNTEDPGNTGGETPGNTGGNTGNGAGTTPSNPATNNSNTNVEKTGITPNAPASNTATRNPATKPGVVVPSNSVSNEEATATDKTSGARKPAVASEEATAGENEVTDKAEEATEPEGIFGMPRKAYADEASEAATSSSAAADNAEGTTAGSSHLAKTGDNTAFLLFVLILMACASAMLARTAARRRS